MAHPEKLLRELWDKQGVPKEEQDRIIRDIEEKARLDAKIGPFTNCERKETEKSFSEPCLKSEGGAYHEKR
jgi:hypothetical protein